LFEGQDSIKPDKLIDKDSRWVICNNGERESYFYKQDEGCY
jgi:hypothetical protein